MKGGITIANKGKPKRLYFDEESNNMLKELAYVYKSESEAVREAVRRLYEAEKNRIARVKEALKENGK